jgi:hypothetical protein
MPDLEADSSIAASAPKFEPDDRWVPADQRFFGLDRRTFGLTLTVFALFIVMSVVLPLIDEGVGYDDSVKAGDVIELNGGVTFVPATGWGITSGVRAGHPAADGYPASATVEDGAVIFKVRTGHFNGDANALLDQIETTSEELHPGVHATGERTTIVTEKGTHGAAVPTTGPHKTGVLAAFVFPSDRIGVEAVATGPADTDWTPTTAVLAMIRSITGPGEGTR